MVDENKRFERKFLTIRRAQRRLIHRLSDIDWEFDELQPELAELRAESAKQNELPVFVVEDEN